MASPKINARRRSPTALGAEHRVLVYPPSPGFEAHTANLGDLVVAENEARRRRGYSYYTDFIGLGTGELNNIAAGTGASSGGTASATGGNRPGLLQVSTGTTATGVAGLRSSTNAIPLGLGAISYEGEFNVPALSDGTESFVVRLGLFESGTITVPAQGVWFEYDHTVGANWLAKTNNNTTPTVVDSAVAVAANTFQRFRIDISEDGAAATFKIGGATVATITTTLPVAGAFTGFGFQIVKTVGTTTRTLRVDWLAFDYQSASLIRA